MTASIPTLSSQYEPKTTEAKWQKFWEENEVFKADPSKPGEMYSVVIPPPNVTGSLHMGHAFEASLIDSIVRYQRMLGKNTLCLPGTDHAVLLIENGYDRAFGYRATMHVRGRATPTDVCLVRPHLRGIEHWPYAIESIDLSSFRLVPWREGQQVTCQ